MSSTSQRLFALALLLTVPAAATAAGAPAGDDYESDDYAGDDHDAPAFVIPEPTPPEPTLVDQGEYHVYVSPGLTAARSTLRAAEGPVDVLQVSGPTGSSSALSIFWYEVPVPGDDPAGATLADFAEGIAAAIPELHTGGRPNQVEIFGYEAVAIQWTATRGDGTVSTTAAAIEHDGHVALFYVNANSADAELGELLRATINSAKLGPAPAPEPEPEPEPEPDHADDHADDH